MTSTWQRIIKAGKGILEIAQEKNKPGWTTITPHISVEYQGKSRTGTAYGQLEFEDLFYDWDNSYLFIDADKSARFDIDAETLNHLEEIAQAFEEALEIWRKM